MIVRLSGCAWKLPSGEWALMLYAAEECCVASLVGPRHGQPAGYEAALDSIFTWGAGQALYERPIHTPRPGFIDLPDGLVIT